MAPGRTGARSVVAGASTATRAINAVRSRTPRGGTGPDPEVCCGRSAEPLAPWLYWRYRQYMPTPKGMNVPFADDDELDQVRRAATAAGLSTREYIRRAALSFANAVPNEFLQAAVEAHAHVKDAFAEILPEDGRPNEERRSAEAEAGHRLAELDGDQAHGSAA